MTYNDFSDYQQRLTELDILLLKGASYVTHPGTAQAIKALTDDQLEDILRSPYLSRYTGSGDTNLFRILTHEQQQRDRLKQRAHARTQIKIAYAALVTSLTVLAILIYVNFLK